MAVYRLTRDLVFPPPEGASADGLVAVGGDTRPERLVLAYSQGIFPWPHQGLPLLWFSPDPRFVIRFEHAHVGRSLRKRVRAQPFEIRVDTAFEEVLAGCSATPRPGQDGTWITDDIRTGFLALHDRGIAHSIEAFQDGVLVGGLYGVAIGKSFCGESMFAHAADASKIAMVALLGNLAHWDFHFVDCQVHTEHLARFGAEQVPRTTFLELLRRAVAEPTRTGPWRFPLDPVQALAQLEAIKR
jgi:leucyl/phenylalanyl-tRNA--protein transferase